MGARQYQMRWTSTQLHTNPSLPSPGRSPSPLSALTLTSPLPHRTYHALFLTGPLPLATPLVCTVRKRPTYPSAVPISLSPPLKGPRVRLFGLAAPDHDSFAAVSPTDRVLSSCTIFPYFSLHTHSAFPPIITRRRPYYFPSRPLSQALLPSLSLPPSRRRIIQPIHSFVQAARMVFVFITR